MIRNILTILGPLIAAVGFIPYLKDAATGKVKPRIASWASWTLITGIATIAAIVAHAYVSATLTGILTIVEGAVLVAGLRQGDWEYGWLDAICQALSLTGIVAWLFTKDPVWALVFNILADFSAVIPTLHHSWVKPHEELWQPYALSGFGSFISFLGIKGYFFADVAFPIYLCLGSLLIAGTIYGRQRVVKKPA